MLMAVIHVLFVIALFICDAVCFHCPVKQQPIRPSSMYCNNEHRKNPFGNNTIDMDTYKPPFPAFITSWPNNINQIILVVFGTQTISNHYKNYEEYNSLITESLNTDQYRPTYWDAATFVDVANITNYIYLAYFTDIYSYSNFMKESKYGKWIKNPERLQMDDNGYFEEIFFIPIENAETIHTINYYENDIKGISNLADMFYEDKRHGYFLSARDRMCASAFNDFAKDYNSKWTLRNDAEMEHTRGKRYENIPMPNNLNIIRSGQDLTNAADMDKSKYLKEIKPVLMKGMQYLIDNPIYTNCISLRFITDINKSDYQIRQYQTAGFGYFVNLFDLEMWAKYHKTHLDIFNKYINIASKGDLSSIYLWHEVFVVSHGYANYINVHNKTGFLRWYGKEQNEYKNNYKQYAIHNDL